LFLLLCTCSRDRLYKLTHTHTHTYTCFTGRRRCLGASRSEPHVASPKFLLAAYGVADAAGPRPEQRPVFGIRRRQLGVWPAARPDRGEKFIDLCAIAYIYLLYTQLALVVMSAVLILPMLGLWRCVLSSNNFQSSYLHLLLYLTCNILGFWSGDGHAATGKVHRQIQGLHWQIVDVGAHALAVRELRDAASLL